jgi:DNA-binding transcriptional LysR family regulator
MLNLNRLRILREVARLGSLSKAAEVIGHTVSAVSQQIATLEQETGAQLIERHPRGVYLTEAGRTLAGHTDVILAEVHAAELALAALGAGKTGQLRIASFTTANAVLLPHAVRLFVQRNPGLTLALTEADCDESTVMLERREIDLALVYEFPAVPLRRKGLRLTPLLDDPLHVVLPAGHCLADHPNLTLADLADEQWIQGAHRSSTTSVLPHACRRAGFEPRISFRTDDQMTVRGLVSAGLGIALASSIALRATPPDLVARPLYDPALVRRIFAAVHADAPALPAVDAMVGCLHETVPTASE